MRVSKEHVLKGAYVKYDAKNPVITLVASGSEVSLALDSAKMLERENIPTQVVSAPSLIYWWNKMKAILKSFLRVKF